MAKGKTASKTVIQNNTPSSTVTKTVELVVVNDQLVPDNKDINPGVNTVDMKN